MNWIVLDLEWNQPSSFQSAAYRKIGDKLLFEVLQFGAAKLNEQLEIVDNISILVCPTYYQTIHSRIQKITGLNRELLCDADAFPEAMKRFQDWCGEDYAIVTWGADDISVLAQNVECFEVEWKLPHVYNLQGLYGKSQGTNGQTALKAAMEALAIEEDENRAFHNAMHDAYYTARVFQKLPEPEKIRQYEVHPKKLIHNPTHNRIRVTHVMDTVEEALGSEWVQSPACPLCEKAMHLNTEVIPQAAGRYVALAKCAKHGLMFMKLRFIRLKDQTVGMNLVISPATDQYRRYVHTKELQYQLKRKRGDYADWDVEDLSSAVSSNMPFDEN